MPVKTLLVIENTETRTRVINLLEPHQEKFIIIGKYYEYLEKHNRRINEYFPDLVICDLEDSSSSPFDLISAIPISHSNFVFILKEDNPVIKALKFASLYYLIQPFTDNEFHDLILKARSKFKGERPNSETQFPNDRISLSTHKGYLLVNLSDILYITSSGNYCTIVLENGEKFTLTKLIGDFENLLPKERFVRTHQSYIVNVKHITEILKEEGTQVVLRSGVNIPIARRRKKALLDLLGINGTRSNEKH